MQPDDELCLCFHVTKRKVQNYLRVEKPRAASQLSDCHGAGTGCGWCRKALETLFAASQDDRTEALPSAEEYAKARSAYIEADGGTPPPEASPMK